MQEAEQISINITSRILAVITSTDSGWPLRNPVYAINWFDTKSLPIYNFYNFLAARSVRAVGGHPIFKGRVTRVLHGSNDDRRDVVLIVNYPSPQCFLNMLKTRYFMLVSVLRMLAVKQFTFSFTRPTSTPNSENDADFVQTYLIHHFRGDDISSELLALSEKAGLRILYSGTLSARISSGSVNETERDINCLMDGVAILQAENDSVIDDLVASADYQAIILRTSSSFVGRMDRLM